MDVLINKSVLKSTKSQEQDSQTETGNRRKFAGINLKPPDCDATLDEGLPTLGNEYHDRHQNAQAQTDS